MEKEMKKAQIGNYQRIQAIDGTKLNWETVKKNTSLISRNIYTTRPMLGGSLSHLKAWKEFVRTSDQNSWCVIFEDDAKPIPNFLSELALLQKEVLDFNQKNKKDPIEIVNLVCLESCCPDENSPSDLFLALQGLLVGLKRKKVTPNLCRPAFSLSGAGYLLSYSGALKLIKGFEKKILGPLDVQWNIYLTQYASKKRLVLLNKNSYQSTIWNNSYPYFIPLLLELLPFEWSHNWSWKLKISLYGFRDYLRISFLILIYVIIGYYLIRLEPTWGQYFFYFALLELLLVILINLYSNWTQEYEI